MFKKISILLSLFGGLIFANTIIDVSGEKTNLEINHENPEVIQIYVNTGDILITNKVTDHGDFTQLLLPDYHLSSDAGEPELPEIHRLIEIPQDANTRIEIVSSKYEEYDLGDLGIINPIFPSQPSVSKSQKPEDITFIINSEVYSKNNLLGKDLVSVDIQGQLRAIRLANINIRPVDYNPASGILRIYSNLEVNIHFDNANFVKTDNIKETYSSPYFESIYNQVSNYTSTNRDDLIADPVSYVIISSPIFLNALNDFIEWKTEKGFNVIIGNTSEIGSSTSSIKGFIENLYYNPEGDLPAPSFVLFVGDIAQLPSYNGTTGSHVTDLYYVDMTGDMIPDIHYGRFSAQNISQLESQISKTLEYEKYEMPDPSYLEEVLMVAGVDASYASTYGNGQINYGNSYYFNEDHDISTHTYLYPASDAAGAAAAIIQDYSEGVGFANYTAHCSSAGWADPSFTVSDVSGLYNTNQYNLMIGNCCTSTAFDVESFGEAILRAENTGAVGYIGGTNSTYWNEDYWWGVGNGNITANPTYLGTGPGVYDCSFHENNEDNWAVVNSTMMMAGNLAVVEAGGSLVDYYWEIYHLMGDPSVSTYFGIPEENNLSYPEFLPLGSSSITISGEPYTYVGITQNGNLIGSGQLDRFGSIDLSLSGANIPGNAQIVGSCQNHQPYFGEILIASPEGPYVMVESSSFTAGSPASDDLDMIQFGETVSLNLNLENVGNDDANGVEVNLTTNDPYINITNSSVTAFNLASDNSYNVEGFEFVVDGNVPNEYNFEIICNIAANGESWESTLNFTAYAPSLEVSSVIGSLDPGATSDIEINIENVGGADLHGPWVNISGDNYVNIDNVSFNPYVWPYGGPSGVDVSNLTLTVSVSPSTPIGHIAEFNIAVTSSQPPTTDYELILTFSIPVGQVIANFESGLGSLDWDLSCGGLGCSNWDANNTEAYSGNGSIQSGSIANNQTSDLSVTLDITAAGTIEFYYKVSAEYSSSGNYFYDGLEFYIDNTLKGQFQTTTSGDSPWTFASFDVPEGEHTFRWSYVKDGGGGSTDCDNTDCADAAWVDDIIFPPAYIESEGMAGDINMDEVINVLDVILIINMILGSENENVLADMNSDGNINIQDIILVINLILSDNLSRAKHIDDIKININSNTLNISSLSPIAGIELHTSGQYIIDKKIMPKGWKLFNNENTIIMVDIDKKAENSNIEIKFSGDMVIEKNLFSDWCGHGYSAKINKVPSKVNLNSSYPNPFNPITSISYDLSYKDHVNLSIFNLMGQNIETLVEGTKDAGTYSINWNASSQPSGMYFLRLETSNETYFQKLMLIK